ncbi:DsbA family protein [Mesobacillus sp. LC4]
MNSNTNKPFKMAVVITIIIFALLIALVLVNNMKSDTTNNVSFDKQPSIEGQPVLGDPDAPVTVVEFGDFKCPACKAWSQNFYPQLVKDYVETGKVKFAYINVLFHGEESKLGSLAAESVFKQNPESYWIFNKEMFKAQPAENHDDLWITKEKILEIASGIPNIDVEQLEADINDQTEMDEVNKDSQLVEEFEVKLTPSIMVNGTMVEDPFDYEQIKLLIDQALEDK